MKFLNARISLALGALLALVAGVLVAVLVSTGPAGATGVTASGSGHLAKVKPVQVRAGRNKLGHKIRQAAPRKPAAAPKAASTGPIVIDFQVGGPNGCEQTPADARAAFQAAVDVWNAQIVSALPIHVAACWVDFGDPSVLGGAGPDTIAREFPGLRPATWYPIALANQISGADINGSDPEIDAFFASTQPDWYFGTDGNTPLGQFDFESVVLHELGHGLGYTNLIEGLDPNGADTGRGYWGFDDGRGDGNIPMIFDRFATDNNGRDLISYPNGSTALGSVLRSSVGFRGANGVLTNGGGRPALYAPATWSEGSSAAHLDEDLFPAGNADALMTPILFDGESEHSPGPIVTSTFQDIGWAAQCTPSSGAISTLFHPVAQQRAYAGGTVLEAGDAADMPILGRAGVPTDGVAAVVVNVEVANPSAAGYISVTPGCTTSQTASQEFTRGATLSVQTTVRLDATGHLRLRLSAGKAAVFVDVAGYYMVDTAPDGSRFHAVPTTRANVGGTRVTAGTPLHLTVAGRGIPADGTVAAVTATVEVSAPTATGYVRVTPDGVNSQTATQEFGARQTISNLVTAAVVDGKIQISLSAGSATVFVDVNGYYSTPEVTTGQAFHPLTTARANPGGTTVASTSDLHQPVAGRVGVPVGASAVTGIVEVAGPTAAGYVRVTPDGVVSQTATQEFGRGQTISNAVAVGLSASAGRVQAHLSAGRATVFFDISGYFA